MFDSDFIVAIMYKKWVSLRENLSLLSVSGCTSTALNFSIWLIGEHNPRDTQEGKWFTQEYQCLYFKKGRKPAEGNSWEGFYSPGGCLKPGGTKEDCWWTKPWYWEAACQSEGIGGDVF